MSIYISKIYNDNVTSNDFSNSTMRYRSLILSLDKPNTNYISHKTQQIIHFMIKIIDIVNEQIENKGNHDTL